MRIIGESTQISKTETERFKNICRAQGTLCRNFLVYL